MRSVRPLAASTIRSRTPRNCASPAVVRRRSKMSLSESTPTTAPWSSTTGRPETRRSRMVCAALNRLSSDRATATSEVMASRTWLARIRSYVGSVRASMVENNSAAAPIIARSSRIDPTARELGGRPRPPSLAEADDPSVRLDVDPLRQGMRREARHGLDLPEVDHREPGAGPPLHPVDRHSVAPGPAAPERVVGDGEGRLGDADRDCRLAAAHQLLELVAGLLRPVSPVPSIHLADEQVERLGDGALPRVQRRAVAPVGGDLHRSMGDLRGPVGA